MNGRRALQFERLLSEVTATLPSGALLVDRDGEASRVRPVKATADLGRVAASWRGTTGGVA